MITVNEIEIIFSVPSIEETLAWYERVLGWKGGMDVVGPDGRCDFGGVCAREEPMLYIDFSRCKGEAPYQNDPCHLTLLVYVDDVDALYRQVLENGAQPEGQPQHQFWGARTFHLRDLNGLRLHFAQKLEDLQGPVLQERYEA